MTSILSDFKDQMQHQQKWTEAQLTRSEDQAQHRHQLLNAMKERLVRLSSTGSIPWAGFGACPSGFLVSLTKLPATWEIHFSLVMVTLPFHVTPVYLRQWFPDPKRAPVPPLNIKFLFIDKLRIVRDLLCKFCLVLNIDTPSPYCGWYIKMQRVWIPQQQLALGTGPVPFN